MAKLLLEHGADLTAKNFAGETPLDFSTDEATKLSIIAEAQKYAWWNLKPFLNFQYKFKKQTETRNNADIFMDEHPTQYFSIASLATKKPTLQFDSPARQNKFLALKDKESMELFSDEKNAIITVFNDENLASIISSYIFPKGINRPASQLNASHVNKTT